MIEPTSASLDIIIFQINNELVKKRKPDQWSRSLIRFCRPTGIRTPDDWTKISSVTATPWVFVLMMQNYRNYFIYKNKNPVSIREMHGLLCYLLIVKSLFLRFRIRIYHVTFLHARIKDNMLDLIRSMISVCHWKSV